MSGESKKEDEPLRPMINESPDIWQMIDWVFHAGAPISAPDDDENNEKEEEKQ